MARFTAENTILAREIIARYPRAKSALIPLLHLAQEQDGYVADDAMEHIAELIGVTPAEVLGTCSFYEMFKREPVGEYLVNVCTNIACMLLGGEELLHHLEERLGITSGSTTADGRFTIEDVECIAACTEAPCLQVNYRYFYKVTPGRRRRADRRPAARPPRPRGAPSRRPRPHAPVAAAGSPRRQRRPRRGRGAGVAPHRRRPRRRMTVSDAAPIVSTRFGLDDGHTLERYLATGGYEGLKAALAKAPTAVGDEVKAASLLGRGGAGFPAGTKWGFCPPGVWPRYLVVNGDESEPGTYKDRLLMEKDPHQLIEGVLIACYAIGAAQAFLYVRGEMALAQERIAQALNDAYAAGYIGKNILGSDFSVDVVLHWGAGAYIVGEETALIESLEGNRGMPRLKPPFFPAAKGLYLQPTVVNNVETLANLPVDHRRNGGAKFAELGAETSRGMRLFAVSGHVQRPGVYEVEFGVTTFRDLIYAPVYGGGIRDGHELKAYIPGGASAPWFYEEHLDLPLEAGAVGAAGSMLGLRCHRRHGRHHRRREGVLARRAVLRPRVVRQVHAVPRGHQLAREGAAPHPRRPRSTRRRRPAARRLRQHQPRDRLAAQADDDLPARPECRVADRVGGRPLQGRVRRLLRRHRGVARGHQRQGVHPAAHRGRRCLTPRRPPETVIVTVNGKEIEAAPGELVIEAAERNGIYIPRFCYHPRMEPVGMCRMCVVEIDTGRGPALQPACMIPVAPGHGRSTPRARSPRRRRTASSSSSSSTTRSTARCATRAASARCRTRPSRTDRARAASSRRSATTRSRS